MHRYMVAHLRYVAHLLKLTPQEAAWKMITGRFQRVKCLFGTPTSSLSYLPALRFDVPSLSQDGNFPEANIQRGQLVVPW